MDDIIMYNELKGDILRKLVEIQKWELADIKFGSDQSECIEREKKTEYLYRIHSQYHCKPAHARLKAGPVWCNTKTKTKRRKKNHERTHDHKNH